MNRAERSNARDAFADELLTLIARHDEILGPSECTIHDDHEDCTDDCELQPVGDVFTRQVDAAFLTIGYAGGRDESENYVTHITPRTQSAILTSGLIRYADRDWN